MLTAHTNMGYYLNPKYKIEQTGSISVNPADTLENNIAAVLKVLLRYKFPHSTIPIDNNTDLTIDFNADTARFSNLMLELEYQFNIEISLDEEKQLKTFKGMTELVRGKANLNSRQNFHIPATVKESLPINLRFSRDLLWGRMDGTTLVIGLTAFASNEGGDMVYADVSSLGKSLKRDDVFGSVECVKTVADLFMPMDGTVTIANHALDQQPNLINDDPYGAGWIIKIQIVDPRQFDLLLDATQYRKLIRH